MKQKSCKAKVSCPSGCNETEIWRDSTSEKVNKNLVRTYNRSESRILLAYHQGKPVEEEISQLKIGKFHFWLGHGMNDSLFAFVSSLNLGVPLDFSPQ